MSPRVAVACLLLLASACAGGGRRHTAPSPSGPSIVVGPESAGPGRGPSPGSSPASSGLSPAQAPPGARATPARATGAPSRRSPAPAPGRAGTPQPIPPEPAAALGALLSAIDREDYVTVRAATTDAAGALMLIRDIIAQENAAQGATTDNRVQVDSQPRVLQSSADAATVAVKARIHSEVSGPKGRQVSDDTVEGPVTMRLVGGAWRAADFVYTGQPLGPGFFRVDQEQTDDGLMLAVGSILTYKRTTAVLIRFASTGGDQGRIDVRSAVLTAADGTVRPKTQFIAFEQRPNPLGVLGFERVDGKPASLQVTVYRQKTGRTSVYRFTF